MTKNKICFSLDEKVVSAIERISMARAISKSEVVDVVLSKGLSKMAELTWAERTGLAEKQINLALDSLLLRFNLRMEGEIMNKFLTCLYMVRYKTTTKYEQNQAKIIELSLFELLKEIQTYDMALFNSITTIMGKIGRIRARFFQMYPKKGMTV